MKYTGLLLKESLQDDKILKHLSIIKIEIWNIVKTEGNQPKNWTAVRFEINEEKVDETSKLLSESLKPKEWYITISGDNTRIVIFPNKIFKYKKGDLEKKNEAIEFGKTIEIPEQQLDWSD